MEVYPEGSWTSTAVSGFCGWFNPDLPHSRFRIAEGMHPSYLQAAFSLAGLLTCAGSMDPDVLRFAAGRGRPVCCLVRHGDAGHWVVSRGVARGRVYYHDPASGPGSERVEAFVARWVDHDSRGTEFLGYGVAAWPRT